jgi:hypothetical protein
VDSLALHGLDEGVIEVGTDEGDVVSGICEWGAQGGAHHAGSDNNDACHLGPFVPSQADALACEACAQAQGVTAG